MSNFLIVAVSIKENLTRLNATIDRIQKQIEKARISGDEYYWDAVSANLVSFYSGCESVFKLVANDVDFHCPQGGDWHIQLMKQMITENIYRPQVISLDTFNLLSEYRAFRHLFMNNYVINLNISKLEVLADKVHYVNNLFQHDVSTFMNIMSKESQIITDTPDTNEYER